MRGAGVLAVAVMFGIWLPSATPQPMAKKLVCLGKTATIVGTARADSLRGTRRVDVIVLLGGGDSVTGLAGNDLVCGGPGDDILQGGAGSDRLHGGPGFDTCRTGERLVACEETRPALPTVAGAVREGVYVAGRFRPRLVFRLGSGWYVGGPGSTVLVDLQFGPQQLDPVLGLDSFSAGQSVAQTVARLTSPPGVDATAPTQVIVGGSEGQQFLVTVTVENVVFPGIAEHFNLDRGDRARFTVVSVSGRTVTVVAAAAVGAGGDLESFLPTANEVLETMEWVR